MEVDVIKGYYGGVGLSEISYGGFLLKITRWIYYNIHSSLVRTMQEKDYYEILGVSRNATTAEIKRAYRRCAKEYHPDINEGDNTASEKFKKASEAYEVLSDPRKRRIYDTYGRSGLENAGYSGFSGFSGDIFDIIEDIFGATESPFSDFFGFGRRRRTKRPPSPKRGSDLRYDIQLKLEEALYGVEKEIEIYHMKVCDLCGGEGTEEETDKFTVCSACQGTGQITQGSGFFTITSTCGRCKGSGYEMRSPCKRCGGDGRVKGKRTINIEIPRGVEDGYRLRVPGEGEAGYLNGPPGDLYIFIHLKPHSEYEKVNGDLKRSFEITVPQAVLGDKISINTLNGDADLKIPSGVQTGDILKVKNKGFPRLNSNKRGDLLIEIKVKTPEKLSRKEKKLYKELLKISKGE